MCSSQVFWAKITYFYFECMLRETNKTLRTDAISQKTIAEDYNNALENVRATITVLYVKECLLK